jgi:hypothetical protein
MKAGADYARKYIGCTDTAIDANQGECKRDTEDK